MKAINKLRSRIRQLRSMDWSIKLILLVPILFGIYQAVKSLFFNFYILTQGYDKGFLGLANSMTPAASLVLVFPLGVLTDRIGRKRAVFSGVAITAFSYLLFLLVRSPTLILAMLFLSGVGEALYFVAVTPLLTRLTNKENRITVFSLYAAFGTFAGVFGSYVGGLMPDWFSSLLEIDPGSFASYRGILLASFGVLLLSLIPVSLIPRGQGETQANPAVGQSRGQAWRNVQEILHKKIVWQLFFPNLAVGLGAALMVPYLNIFLVETFQISDQTLGTLFSLAYLVTGIGTLAAPWLARRLGTRIRALVLAQGSSLIFLLLLGFSPWLGLAVVGFLGRNVLMNMSHPLFNTFSMEQVDDHEQGTLNSMLSFAWQSGWAVMPVVSGFIQEHYGFAPIFITTSILYALSTALIWHFFKDSETPLPSGAAALS